MSGPTTPFPAAGHDHRDCVNSALLDAERHCASRGLRLTPLRRRVLELIWRSHRPSGAYELLEQLAAEGHRPSPPTVYRALEFLLQHTLIHRVSSRNAFVGCSSPGDEHMAQIFLCDRCGIAVEQTDPSLNRQILDKARDMRFVVHSQTVELTGLCPQCQGAGDGE